MKDFLCSEQMCLLFRQPPFSPVLITEILYIICRGTRIKTFFPCPSYFFFKSRSVKFTQVGWQREAPHRRKRKASQLYKHGFKSSLSK